MSKISKEEDEFLESTIGLRRYTGQGLDSLMLTFFEDKDKVKGIIESLVESGHLKGVLGFDDQIIYCINDGAYCIEEYHGKDEYPHVIHFMRTYIGMEDENMPFFEEKTSRDEFVKGEMLEKYEEWIKNNKESLELLVKL